MRIPALLCLVLLLPGCMMPVGQRVVLADELAREAGMSAWRQPGPLPLAGYARSGSGPLWVFIEGDGLAWVTPTRPSMNPTPLNPVALRLAAADPAGNVLYLARPGQYLDAPVAQRYWLSARFAPEVVDATEQAVRRQAAATGAETVYLVGYSGGGAVAALVAARLAGEQGPALAGLVTVAGNLDHVRWTQQLGLTALTDSLNAADQASRLASVPQRHLVGTEDKQVPRFVLESFLSRLGSQHCVEVVPVAVNHGGPWRDAWLSTRAGGLPCAVVPE